MDTRAMEPANLRCDFLQDPLGIDSKAPRLSWVLESNQRGYRQNGLPNSCHIRTRCSVGQRQGDVGPIGSHSLMPDNPEIVAIGFLEGRVWDQDGQVSAWSAGLVDEWVCLPKRTWQAKWISAAGAGTAARRFIVTTRPRRPRKTM